MTETTTTIREDLQGNVAEIADRLVGLQTDLPEGIYTTPGNFTLHSIDSESLNNAPRRTRRVTTFTDVRSFLAYFDRFKGATPIVFAHQKEEGVILEAIFDYDENEKPKWGEHIAKLDLRFHYDFKPFKDISGKLQSQEAFAEFVEDMLPIFVAPTGAEMLELVQDLKGVKNVTFGSSKRLDNGAVKIEYKEVIEGGGIGKAGDIRIPEKFTLATPLFLHGPMLEFNAAFRYRVSEQGTIQFGLKLLRIKETIDKAMQAVVNEVEAHTDLPVQFISSREDNAPKGVTHRILD